MPAPWLTAPLVGPADAPASDPFFAAARLIYFEFVFACIGLAQVVVQKDEAPLAKVRNACNMYILTLQTANAHSCLESHSSLLPCSPVTLCYQLPWLTSCTNTSCSEYCSWLRLLASRVGTCRLRASLKACLVQFRDFVDGPRGLMAEGLKQTSTTLPASLIEAFAYLAPSAGGAKSSRGSRGRSRRGSRGGSIAGKSVQSVGSSVAGDLADLDAELGEAPMAPLE